MSENVLENLIKLMQYLSVVVANDSQILACQPFCPFPIVFFLESMAVPIDFDNQTFFSTVKIDYELTDWMLPAKFKTF